VYTNNTIDNCNPTVIETIPVTVSIPSRIYAAGGGAYDSGSSNLAEGQVYCVLRDAADTTTIAYTPLVVGNTGPNAAPVAGVSTYIESSGIMRSGSSLGFGGTPFTASPGNNLLKLIALGANGTCAGGAELSSASLTYILIGS
jgi:hypothetical protein